MTSHEMFDGRLQVYKRGSGRAWQCAARVGGKRFRTTTREENLARAKQVAEEWYLGLRGKLGDGKIEPDERTFKSAAREYLREVKVLTIGSRSPRYVELLELRLKVHILPFFGDTPLSKVNRGMMQRYRVKRAEDTIEKTTKVKDGIVTSGKPPARSTMLQEIVHIRQILKFAEGHGWIPFVPSLSTPYMTQGKKGRRAWFSPEEYEQLYKATRKRITDGKRRGWKAEYEDLHDFVLFMANTGLRPDEAMGLQIRDVAIEDDYGTKKIILVIDVRGKTGVGYCKSTPNAVYPFQQLRQRRLDALRAAHPDLSDKALEPLLANGPVFPSFRRDLFNKILAEEGLKFDRDGQRRTAYSLRHTYISMRLMEGANIHMVANNCRTSIQMIEEHYAAHIKDRLDASFLNVERPRAAKRSKKAKPDSSAYP